MTYLFFSFDIEEGPSIVRVVQIRRVSVSLSCSGKVFRRFHNDRLRVRSDSGLSGYTDDRGPEVLGALF
jgi:hypothetical protein